jgi:hypothetical protein
MSVAQFKALLDSIMDYQNNNIAIHASRYWSGKASGREAAEVAIEYFYQFGLTFFNLSADGNTGTILVNQKISYAEYLAFKTELLTRGHDGNYRGRSKDLEVGNKLSKVLTDDNKSQRTFDTIAEGMNIISAIKANTQQKAEDQITPSKDIDNTIESKQKLESQARGFEIN